MSMLSKVCRCPTAFGFLFLLFAASARAQSQPDVVGLLAVERELGSAAGSSIASFKGDEGKSRRAKALYGRARAGFDALIAGIGTDLKSGRALATDPILVATTREVAAARTELRAYVTANILPAEERAQVALDGRALPADRFAASMTAAMPQLWSRWQTAGHEQQAAILESLTAQRWPPLSSQ